ncbi:MAG: CD1871A family CXXC motif-containing protein [Anaerovoracaceae bacterium]
MRIEKKTAVRILLLAAGSLMLVYGIWRDEVIYVFNKAVKICLECIGIG